MPGNGIFNRPETLMKAQQDYDLYAHIANKPRHGRMVNTLLDEEGQVIASTMMGHKKSGKALDTLYRMLIGSEDTAPKARTKGTIRTLVKLVFKTMAIPVLLLYVGPRKVAQVAVPLAKNIAHMVAQLRLQITQQLQQQYIKAQPFLAKVRMRMQELVARIKTTMKGVTKGYTRAKEFINQKFLQPMTVPFAKLAEQIQHALYRAFGIKLPFSKIQLPVRNSILKQMIERSQGFLSKNTKQFRQDIKAELRDIYNIIQKIPFKKIYTPIKQKIAEVMNAMTYIPQLLRQLRPTLKINVSEAIVNPIRKTYKKVKQIVEEAVKKALEVPQAVIAKVQTAMVPLINLFALSTQFIHNQKVKLGLRISHFFDQAAKRYRAFVAKAGGYVSSTIKIVKDILFRLKRTEWLHVFYRWFLNLVGNLAVWLQEKGTQFLYRASNFLKKTWKWMHENLFPLLKQVPSALLWLIEWAFGRPGVWFIQAFKFIGHYSLKGVRYIVQLIHEVYLELR